MAYRSLIFTSLKIEVSEKLPQGLTNKVPVVEMTVHRFSSTASAARLSVDGFRATHLDAGKSGKATVPSVQWLNHCVKNVETFG
jgi:hypothetical protein